MDKHVNLLRMNSIPPEVNQEALLPKDNKMYISQDNNKNFVRLAKISYFFWQITKNCNSLNEKNSLR